MNFAREALGLFGSALILISMCSNSQTYKGTLWLRIVNGIGSIVCLSYGIWIQSFSMTLMNIICLILDIWYLIKAVKENNKSSEEGNVSG